MRVLFILFCSFFFLIEMSGQKMLRLDHLKKGAYRTFIIGQEITFQIKGDDNFYTMPITDLDAESQTIHFQAWVVKVDRILIVKNHRNNRLWRGMERKLQIFGLSWLAFSGIDAIFDPPFKKGGIIVPAVSIALGWVLRKTLVKDWEIGDKNTLRVLDLDMTSPAA